MNKKNTFNLQLVEKAEASFCIVVNGKSFSPAAQIFDSKNPNLPLCDTVFDPPVLWQHLAFIQKWQRIRNFQNANTAWKIDNLPLKVEVFTKINNTETLILPSAENFYTIKKNTALNIRLTNTDGRKLFLGAALLSAQFGMTKLLLPQTSIDEKGKTLNLFGEKPVIMTIAEHRKTQPQPQTQTQTQPTETHIYKLIFSTKNIDISTWQQADLPVPKTTKKVMRSESRGFSMDMFDEMYADDWATLNLEFLVQL